MHDDLGDPFDDIWANHLHTSQTTPTILHNKECYPRAMTRFVIVPKVDKLGGGM